MSNEGLKTTESIEVDSNASEMSAMHEKALDDFLSDQMREILREAGVESPEEMLGKIREGAISTEEASGIENKIRNLTKYKGDASPILDRFYYPRGKPAYRLENVEDREIEKLEGIENVLGFQVLPNGDIVSGGSDGKVNLWKKMGDGKYDFNKPIEVGEHDDAVLTLQVLLNGDVVSVGGHGGIRLWRRNEDGTYDVDNPIEVGKHEVWDGAFQVLPNGNVVSGGKDGKVMLWARNQDGTYDVDNPIWLGRHDKWVSSLHVLPNGDVVSGDMGGKVSFWTRKEDGTYDMGKPIEVGRHSHESGIYEEVTALQVLPNGDIVSGGHDSRIITWSKSKRRHNTHKMGRDIRAIITRSEKGHNIYRAVDLINVEKQVRSHKRPLITHIEVLPNGDVVSGAFDGKIVLWVKKGDGKYDVRNPVEIGQHNTSILAFQVIPNGDIVFRDRANRLYILRQNKDE